VSETTHKFNLRLPLALWERLEREAQLEGCSLNTLILAYLRGPRAAESEPVPDCDHEPYRRENYLHCYRCGAPL
jgi:hypothetical protein